MGQKGKVQLACFLPFLLYSCLFCAWFGLFLCQLFTLFECFYIFSTSSSQNIDQNNFLHFFSIFLGQSKVSYLCSMLTKSLFLSNTSIKQPVFKQITLHSHNRIFSLSIMSKTIRILADVLRC